MKLLAFLSESAVRKFSSDLTVCETVEIYGYKFNIGLLDWPMPSFDETGLEHQDYVLVRKNGFSVNFRDKGIVMNKRSTLFDPDTVAVLPVGSDFVGEVIAIGKHVVSFKIGDRVIPNAHYPSINPNIILGGIPTNEASKEYEVFHHLHLIKVPEELPDNLAAGLTVGAQTAYGMIRKLAPSGLERVLLTSATSNTSLFIASALINIGCEVTVMTAQANFKPRLEQMGVSKVFVVKNRNELFNSTDTTEPFGQGECFDIIIDPFADIFMPQLLDITTNNGKYMICGFYHQSFRQQGSPFSLHNLLVKIISKNVSLIGNCLGESGDLDKAISDFLNGRFNIEVDSVFSGKEISGFINRSFAETGRLGKVIYKFM